MANLNLEKITKNIFRLIDYSGISDIAFANILDISEKQFRLIKSGNANFNIDNINKACEFFYVSLSKINNKEIEIENNYREKLAFKHKNNSEYHTLLEPRPSIRHAIKFRLLSDEDFNTKGLIVSEIREIFLKAGWDFESRYISVSMARSPDLVEIVGKRIIRGKEVNVYQAKK